MNQVDSAAYSFNPWLLIEELRTRSRLVVICVIAGALAAALVTVILPSIYTARTSLLPDVGGGESAMIGRLAGMAGIDVGSDDSLEALYSKIIESESFLLEVIARDWEDEFAGKSTRLHVLLGENASGEGGELTGQEHWDLMDYLRRKSISFTRNTTTGYMELEVSVPRRPQLAADLANHLVEFLDVFLRNLASERAEGRLRFFESRISEARTELTLAEDMLAEFIGQNRAYSESPVLMAEYARHTREVESLTVVWGELRRQMEIARIESLDDKSSVTILDRAVPPERRSRPILLVNILIGAALGFTVLVSALLVRNWPQSPGSSAVSRPESP